MLTAVVGHVEWVEFVRVARLPRQGEIVETEESFAEPAGGGAVAAVQLARLAGECILYTALGDDPLAGRVIGRLGELGVRVEAVRRAGKDTRRAFTYLDDDGERTITTIGERLHPVRADPLPWGELESVTGTYFVAGDADALRTAREARALVATTRIGELLERAGVQLDAVVGSSRDEAERYRPLEPPPRFVVATAGGQGGTWRAPRDARASGPRRRRRGRGATPTDAATASPPGSRSRSAAATRSRRRWRSPRAVARPA